MILLIRKGKRPHEFCINPDCPSKTNPDAQKEIKQLEQHKIEKKCPNCGKDLVLRTSFYGQFLGCSGYPNCKHTERLDGGKSFPKKTPTTEKTEKKSSAPIKKNSSAKSR